MQEQTWTLITCNFASRCRFGNGRRVKMPGVHPSLSAPHEERIASGWSADKQTRSPASALRTHSQNPVKKSKHDNHNTNIKCFFLLFFFLNKWQNSFIDSPKLTQWIEKLMERVFVFSFAHDYKKSLSPNTSSKRFITIHVECVFIAATPPFYSLPIVALQGHTVGHTL